MGFPRTLFTRKGYAASVKRHSANGCPTLLSRKIYHFIERLPRRVLQDTPGAFRYFGNSARENTSPWKIHTEVFCLYSAFLSPTERRGTG